MQYTLHRSCDHSSPNIGVSRLRVKATVLVSKSGAYNDDDTIQIRELDRPTMQSVPLPSDKD
jgi:hypothetical protein